MKVAIRAQWTVVSALRMRKDLANLRAWVGELKAKAAFEKAADLGVAQQAVIVMRQLDIHTHQTHGLSQVKDADTGPSRRLDVMAPEVADQGMGAATGGREDGDVGEELRGGEALVAEAADEGGARPHVLSPSVLPQPSPLQQKADGGQMRHRKRPGLTGRLQSPQATRSEVLLRFARGGLGWPGLVCGWRRGRFSLRNMGTRDWCSFIARE